MTDHHARPGVSSGDAAVTDERHEVAPSKPVTPLTPRRAAPAPEPVEIEVDESVIVSPVASPSPDEVEPAPRGPFDSLPSDPPQPPASPLTSIELLGRAAAANASLSASGAPTPLGGIPRVDGSGAAHVDLADDGPRWSPTFAGAASPRGDGTAPGPAEPEPAADLHRHDLDTDAPLYRPRVPAGEGTRPAAGSADGAEPPLPSGAVEEPSRDPGRAWPLVVIGLLSMAAIALALVWPSLNPAPIEIPAQRVLAPTGSDVDPVELEDPTPFLAAMPATAGAWIMTDAVTNTPGNARLVEWHTLRYSDGATSVTLEARQYYTEAEAREALVRGTGEDDPVLTDATAGGRVVGERAERVDGDTGRVMWTHGTAYFEAVGPADAVLELVETLGL